MRILVINGPNLNMLGTRDPELYGETTLKQLEDALTVLVPEHELIFFQSNSEGALCDRLHRAATDGVDAIVINPGAYAHTSIAIRDALEAIDIPTVEVHLSNVYDREPFRHHSYTAAVAIGQICGLGPYGYFAACRFLADAIEDTDISDLDLEFPE